MNTSSNTQKSHLFSYLLALTLLFILAEISFAIECSKIYLADFKLVANHLTVPLTIVPGVIYFIFAELLLHLVFLLIIWLMARLIGRAFSWPSKKTDTLGITLWFIALLTLLLENRIFFPNSKFSNVIFSGIPLILIQIFFVIFSITLLAAFLFSLYGFFYRFKKKALFLFLGTIVFTSFLLFHKKTVLDASTPLKPNIILIGIDSLRPDFLGFFGYTPISPHIDHFLNNATVFSESLTPLARTYPSWVSILTGIYPKLNTIRTNLADQSHLAFGKTLPAILQRQGYKTIFATDETRFSNIDQRYGFNEIVVPPIGFNDFLLGTLNDFPLSNLVVNTTLGKYLFPHTYANRAVFATYEPNSFLNLLKPMLSQSRMKPVFLAVHFCLPHFPYAWAALPVNQISIHHYQAAIHRADEQFYDFMRLLKQNHFLDHAIVVLLSDHGEAVEMPGDRITDPDLYVTQGKNKVIPHFYPPTATREKVNMSGGHGTDVLGLSQYHTVLAFRSFGLIPNQVKVVPGLVSLMDIKATLLTYLHLPLEKINGVALNDYIFSSPSKVSMRQDFFTESDFSPEAIRSVHPEERKVLFEGIDYFQIDPKTTRVTVKDSMLKMIISSKQYADFYGPWVLALYPQNKTVMTPILVNLETGEWTDNLTSSFAKKSPVNHMLFALKEFFSSDITRIEKKI
ncbi:MAG: hypothetical protein ACD_60C00075G0005 [uncultured bacterium]|nr:MAG: hypothetical protein ACD_60C00075G0005 [uncultured bacterium]